MKWDGIKWEMKYNRMVLYQSDILHSPEIDLGIVGDVHKVLPKLIEALEAQ